MSTDEEAFEQALERNRRLLRELVEQAQASSTLHTLINMPRRYSRPDYVLIDDIAREDEARAATTVYPRSELRELRESELVQAEWANVPAEPVRVELRGSSTLHILDENGRCPACDGSASARNWQREINARIAQDRELQAERYQADRQAGAAEDELNRWEVEHEDYVRVVLDRIARGEKIPERPASFSWLYGPADGPEG